MQEVILIRYSEIFLKGKNFGFFEKKLYDNIVESLVDFPCDVVKMNKRFYVENFDLKHKKKIIASVLHYFF